MAKPFERIVEFFCDGDRCPRWLRCLVQARWLIFLSRIGKEGGRERHAEVFGWDGIRHDWETAVGVPKRRLVRRGTGDAHARGQPTGRRRGHKESDWQEITGEEKEGVSGSFSFQNGKLVLLY